MSRKETETAVSLSDVVVEMAQDRGFFLPEPIKEPPQLPEDVTVVSGSALMKLMSVLAALVAYASSEEAIASGHAKAMSSRYKQVRAQRYIEIKSEAELADRKISEKHIDYELDADDDLVAYRKEEVLAENYARLVRAILTGYEAKYGLLSRELTRRGLDMERER